LLLLVLVILLHRLLVLLVLLLLQLRLHLKSLTRDWHQIRGPWRALLSVPARIIWGKVTHLALYRRTPAVEG